MDFSLFFYWLLKLEKINKIIICAHKSVHIRINWKRKQKHNVEMVDVNQPMISDKERKESATPELILPIASISTTNPQISVTQQSPRSPPPILLDNFKNGNTK